MSDALGCMIDFQQRERVKRCFLYVCNDTTQIGLKTGPGQCLETQEVPWCELSDNIKH